MIDDLSLGAYMWSCKNSILLY